MILILFGPPLAVALIVSLVLYLPFAFIKFPSRAFRLYWTAQIIVAIACFASLLIFQLNGPHKELETSAFSPIGVGDEGLVIIRVIATTFFIATISIFELSIVLGKRLDRWKRENPEQWRQRWGD